MDKIMKILLFALFMIPSACFAQIIEVRFDELPEPVKTKFDPAYFISAYMYSDSTYEVELGIKNKRPRVETTYSKEGVELSVYHYKAGSSPFAWVLFCGFIFYMGSKFI